MAALKKQLLVNRSLLTSLVVLLVATVLTFIVRSQTVAPSIPPVALSSEPLYASSTGDKPTLSLALSVEYPTVGAQYLDQPNGITDATYANTNEYLGYYDAESCYSYNDTPTEIPTAGLTASDYKRFDRSGAATSRKCTNAFSGNFLNWASNSAVDMLRLALSGGDRSIDTPSLTLLQRAMIPNGDPVCMWNQSNFPAKQLLKDGGGLGTYWGAIPVVLVAQAAGSDVWVANTLNQIYFGSSRAGSCSDTSTYTLGGSPPPVQKGPQTVTHSALPAGAVLLGSQGSTHAFSGVKEVWFGTGKTWTVLPAANGIDCVWTGGGGAYGGILDPAPDQTKQCYVMPYTGLWAPLPIPSAGTLNSDGYFFARVKVCDSASNTLQDVRDYDLCTRYPNGNYKPTGTIQKYSNQLRLSAFGYLTDQTASWQDGRYGGVLRAPMKYVGLKTFDINGVDNTPAIGNPNAEWDRSTGVFLQNPDNDTTQNPKISGVINYINKFGRLGPIPGRYKKYDPLSELYYEVIRYLQGLQPSPLAVSNITADMHDGFPVTTTWSDPYGSGRTPTSSNYSCLRSNIIVIGDVNTNDSTRLPKPDTSNNIPDLLSWTKTVENFENNITSNYIDGNGTVQTTANPNSANDSFVNDTKRRQIYGTAYWAHTHDIRDNNWTKGSGPSLKRPGLRVKTFLVDVNENASSNDMNYRQFKNQFFTAAKYGGFESDPSNSSGNPSNIKGNPFQQGDGANNNNVWQDPLRPGEASSYYLQSNARGILNSFNSIFSRSSITSKNIAKSAVANKNLASTHNAIYQGSLDSTDWSGDVIATSISSDPVSLSSNPLWSAVNKLSSLNAPALSRNMVVGKVGATANPVATAFTWGAIETGLQTNLAKLTPQSSADNLGQDRLNFIRGDQSKEGSTSAKPIADKPFRPRTKLLGDIINSGIVYSGDPTTVLANNSNYASFYNTNKGRTPAVFVGANDGMLHAFSATTGDELFGYLPSWMGPKLAALTDPAYLNQHQSYVDSTPAVGEAQVGSSGSASDWKTVLVSGTGGGGSGVFALDVTNPNAFTASNVMWEFTRNDDADMGYVVGTPGIWKIRINDPSPTIPAIYRWFAVVASGVNNYVPDSTGIFSTTGNPALFLLALDKAPGVSWVSTGSNPNYYKISLPMDKTLTAKNATGLINFGVAVGSPHEMTQAYLGDLHGNLWKLDFSLHGASEWTMNKLTAYNKGTSSSPIPYPLYIANTVVNGSLTVQPITAAPIVIAAPTSGTFNTNYIAFGTGKYLEASDITSPPPNSFYVVYDNATTSPDNKPAGNSIISGRGRLQAAASTGTAITVPPFVWGRPLSDKNTTQRSGWYFDFPNGGERDVSSILSDGGSNLYFPSLIPSTTNSTATCAAGGGTGYVYNINIDKGIVGRTLSPVGLIGSVFLGSGTSATALPVTSDSTGRRSRSIPLTLITSGTGGVNQTTQPSTPLVTGRLSWRQINNYQELKRAQQ